MIELMFIEIDWSMLSPLMNIFGFGTSKSKTRSTVAADILELTPGVFGDVDPAVRGLARETRGGIRAGGKRRIKGGVGGEFGGLLGETEIGAELQRTLLDPSFDPKTKGEQALVSSVRDQILGSTALRGLKPTTGGITQGLAPILEQLRQNRIRNLSGAFQTEVGGRGQDVTQRGQTIGGEQAQIDSSLNAFLSLLSLGRQTPVVRGGGATSRGSSSSFKLGF